MTEWDKYADDVISGRRAEGRAMQLACKRYRADRARRDLEFREARVVRAVKVIATLRHFRGSAAGKPFVLQPWQAFIVANIVGFYWRSTGRRRYTSSYIEVSRKNGKTALAAALCLYFLLFDGEAGAEVDLAANSKEQAKIAFEFCHRFARQMDPAGNSLRLTRDIIEYDRTASALRVFAADDTKLDGFNASFALLDEYHAAKTSKVRDVIKSSMGMRDDPHLCTITTAGFDKSSPCYAMRSAAMEVLAGLKEDDSMFIAIYSMDDGDDWTDERNWAKCTPNLGITVKREYLREQVRGAMNNPSEEAGVRTKNLNQWLDVADVWIPSSYIERCTRKIDPDEFTQDDMCWGGVDLASVSDMTAATFLLRRNDDPLTYFLTRYYLPEQALNDSPNRDKYRMWRRLGLLQVTPGNVTDYDYVTTDLMRAFERWSLYRIGYDQWNSTQWAIDATAQGLPIEPYSQTIGNFNRPTRELERLILSGQAVIDDNEITRWMFGNVALKYDHNGNCKPDKGLGRERKIDGVVSMIQALGMYQVYPVMTGDCELLAL